MDFLELRDTLKDLVKVGGFADSDPPPDLARYINEAYREVASETEYNFEDTTVTTVSGTAEYALTTAGDLRDWTRVTNVLYGTDKNPLRLTSELEETTLDNKWPQGDAGTPSRYFLSKPNYIRLCPKPDEAVTVYIHGCRNPAELSADSDVPTLPTRYHEAISLRAAWNYLRRVATGDEYSRAKNYLDESREKMAEFQSEKHAQQRIVRRLARPTANRVYLGG